MEEHCNGSYNGTENGYDYIGYKHQLQAAAKVTIAIKKLVTARNNTRICGEHVLLNKSIYKRNNEKKVKIILIVKDKEKDAHENCCFSN